MPQEHAVESMQESDLDFPVVGIGASAGGIKSLIDFFGETPADSGMAYVIVLHLSPEHISHVDEVLQKVTGMPVEQVTARTPIRPDTVYVISPNSDLRMHDGHLDPTPTSQGRERGVTIDHFFGTLGGAHGNRAFGIVLSGTGSDGTNGLKAVKAGGGVTFAQEPDDAEYDSMPRNAIGSGAVDFVLRAREMPERLAALWQNARAIALPQLEDRPTPEDTAARTEDALREILTILRSRTGHDFSQYKRATLLRRIERRLQVNQLRDLVTYRDYIREQPGECRYLLRDLLISVTSFFRDPQAFAALEKTVVPALLRGRDKGGVVRAWVVGCATGEEAYSVAMLLADHSSRMQTPVEIDVFATDIDEDALAVARTALYPETIAEQISPERLRRYFVHEQGGFRVSKTLRDMVVFATQNVAQDPPFSRIDLITCRNLLIYLNRTVQEKVLDVLHFALRPEGYLMVGLAETVDDDRDGFLVVDKPNRIYQQQPLARLGILMSALPSMTPTRRPGEMTALPARRLVPYGELHQSLLEHYAPPSAVVDEHYDIVHLSENAGRFLQLAGGEPSLNLLRIAPDELRHELRSALDLAMQSMRTVERRGLLVKRGPQQLPISIKVHPVREKMSARTFALVLFDESGEPEGVRPEVEVRGDDPTNRLEARLVDTQAQLRAAVEQHEVQNEELKASNEELQATNEELRATTEELETGKEELQSINEELTTVNQELKNKVDEATRITDDLQNFITSTEIAVLFVDRDLRLMRYTPFARELFNVIPSDIGRPLLDITHKLEQPTLEDDILDVFRNLRVVEREARSSSGRWYLMRILPYRTTEDRIGGAVLTFIDISQRRQAEGMIQHNQAWLQLVVDSVVDHAIMTLDPEGRIKTWNPGAVQIFQYTAEEAIGQPFAMLFNDEDRAAGVPAAELANARERGRADDDRWQVRKDGSRFFASGIAAPLLDAELFGYVKLLRDLTAQRLAAERREEQLKIERSNRAAAEDATRMKDEFVATLSHELRNPLALIQMQADLLLRSKELRSHPKLVGSVETIHEMVRTQAQFVEDLLDVSRARTGRLAIQRQLLALPELIADSIGALRKEAAENGITLDTRIAPEPMLLEADAVRIKQVAWNLLSNALKFTPRGGRIVVTLERDGDSARLMVEDNGQGIPLEMLPHVFDGFRQGETSAKGQRGGLGIGLSLVKQLVELHGGRVSAESKGIDQGARFNVWLPLQTRALPRSQPVARVRHTNGARLKGLRLLVIDDVLTNGETLSELLQLEGATVDVETSARGAIERSRRKRFDVMISDLAMPAMDGYEMLQQIRANAKNGRTPAIAYSGYGGPDVVARAMEAGFDLHLTKPVDIERLIDAIGSVRQK
jgi:two-component system, chemotaxis family, CheB/CheR fusion protein